MNQISKDRRCYTCLGCNRLEIEEFNGTYRDCPNYMKGKEVENNDNSSSAHRSID